VVGNSYAVLRVVEWLEIVMLYSRLWSGWKQSCCTEGRGVAGNSHSIGNAIDWLETIILYSCVSEIEIHFALIVFRRVRQIANSDC